MSLHLVKLNINLTVQRWIEELLTSSYLDSCKALCGNQFELNARNIKLCNSLQATKHDVVITPQTSNTNIVITQFYNILPPKKTKSPIRYCSVSIDSVSRSIRPSRLFWRRILQIFRRRAITEFIFPAVVDHFRII